MRFTITSCGDTIGEERGRPLPTDVGEAVRTPIGTADVRSGDQLERVARRGAHDGESAEVDSGDDGDDAELGREEPV